MANVILLCLQRDRGQAMAQARRERARTSGPAGWMVLLGLMVLAFLIAWITDDDTDNASPAAQSPTPTATTPAPAGAGTATQQVIDQVNQTLTSNGLPFVVGKAELAPASSATLDKVAGILTKNPTIKAEVRGFTDDQGDATKNEQLSLARAQAVVAYLTGKGVAATRLEAKGLGEANPVCQEATEACRARNRRVEFALA